VKRAISGFGLRIADSAPAAGPVRVRSGCRGVLVAGGCWLVALLALSGCVRQRAQVRPPVTIPEAFSAAGTAPLPQRWWETFGDARLNALVDRALAGNLTLRAAWARLDQARAVAAKAGAPLWPSLDGSAGAGRTATHTGASASGGSASRGGGVSGSGGGSAGGTSYATEFSLGLSASYEVDLWGRVRSTRDAARLDAEATRQDLHAAAITLAADVTRTWLRRIEQRRQLVLLDEQIATNEKVLEVITLRFRRGQVPATDVLQQRELVEQRRGERTLVQASLAVLDHQLAILLGEAPGACQPEAPAALPVRPPLPRAGLPAELVRRRPDVRAAELRVQAEDQRVWAAITDQFPRVALSATATTTAAELRDLFDNWLASIAANLTAPLFDAGLRRAEVERTKAVLSERLGQYGQTVLVSLGEVENALVQEAQQAAYVASLRAQLDLSRRAAERTRERYIKGTADFTRYLTTRLSYQGLQRTLLQARRDLLLLRVDLYRALAGGWELARPGKASRSTDAGPSGDGGSGATGGGPPTDG